MAKITRMETRKRGILGWLFLVLFVAFNFVMANWLFIYLDGAPDPPRPGSILGNTIGTMVLLMGWLVGNVILGICLMVTPGKKIIVEERISETYSSPEPRTVK